jgi:hypothetical protein
MSPAPAARERDFASPYASFGRIADSSKGNLAAAAASYARAQRLTLGSVSHLAARRLAEFESTASVPGAPLRSKVGRRGALPVAVGGLAW